jgi:hypothetical protein
MVEYNPYSATAAFPVSSRNPRPLREVDVYRWYFRMDYLGKEVLERLVLSVYSIKIKGLLIINYQAYLQAKAK